MEIKKIINFLNEERKKTGDELLLIGNYSGGNDSGYINFEPFLQDLIGKDNYNFENYINDNLLEYGSFAGEFECEGEIFWDGAQFKMEGTESVTEYFDKENTFKPEEEA